MGGSGSLLAERHLGVRGLPRRPLPTSPRFCGDRCTRSFRSATWRCTWPPHSPKRRCTTRPRCHRTPPHLLRTSSACGAAAPPQLPASPEPTRCARPWLLAVAQSCSGRVPCARRACGAGGRADAGARLAGLRGAARHEGAPLTSSPALTCTLSPCYLCSIRRRRHDPSRPQPTTRCPHLHASLPNYTAAPPAANTGVARRSAGDPRGGERARGGGRRGGLEEAGPGPLL